MPTICCWLLFTWSCPSCSIESEDSISLLQSHSWFYRFIDWPTFPMVFLIEFIVTIYYYSSWPKLLRDVAIWMTSNCCVMFQGSLVLPLTPSTNVIRDILGIILSFLFIIKSVLGVMALSNNTKWILWMSGGTFESLRKSKPKIITWYSNGDTNRFMFPNLSPTLNGVEWTIHVTCMASNFKTLQVLV